MRIIRYVEVSISRWKFCFPSKFYLFLFLEILRKPRNHLVVNMLWFKIELQLTLLAHLLYLQLYTNNVLKSLLDSPAHSIRVWLVIWYQSTLVSLSFQHSSHILPILSHKWILRKHSNFRPLANSEAPYGRLRQKQSIRRRYYILPACPVKCSCRDLVNLII